MAWTFAWERAVKGQKEGKKRPPYREAIAQIVRDLGHLALTPRTNLSLGIARRVRSGDYALEIAKVAADSGDPFSAIYVPLSLVPEVTKLFVEAYLALRENEIDGVGRFPAVQWLDGMLSPELLSPVTHSSVTKKVSKQK